MTAAITPVFASNILASHLSCTCEDSARPAKRRRLGVGTAGTNDTFEGGFEYGTVHCITSEDIVDNDGLINALLASHLAASPRARSTVIDSTLSFNVQTLYRVMSRSSGLQGAPETAQNEAMRALERLNIMKIFDHVGLKEALDEVAAALSSGSPNRPASEHESKPPAGTIEDSEGEEDILDRPSPAESTRAANAQNESAELREDAPHLLILQNLSQVITPLLKNNYTQGQAMLVNFMRSLSHLTRAHDVCTIIFSSATSKSNEEEERLSQFQSCTMRSALGIGLGYLVDVHVFHHQIAKARSAAENAVGPSHPGPQSERADVLEIVEDRFGARVGRWAAFTYELDGTMRNV